MELKTKVHAEDGKQELRITRGFDLPLELLFKAYEEAELVEEWMGTKVLKLENKKHGSFHFVTTDPMGNKHGFNGVIHSLFQTKKSYGPLKWTTRLSRFGLSISILKRSQKIPANSIFILCTDQSHTVTRCYRFHLRKD